LRNDDLFALLATYALTTLAVLIFESFYRRTWVNVIGLATALIALVATTVLGGYLEPGSGALDVLLGIVREHSPRHLVAGAIGVAAALPWVGRLFNAAASRPPRKLPLAEQLVIAASIAGVVGGAGLMLWNMLFDVKTESQTKAFAPQFVIDSIAHSDFLPTRIAVDALGNVYMSYFWTGTDATFGGAIVKLTEDPDRGSFTQETVANHDLLFRVTGLAAKDGDLYISRSGFHPRADAGRISYVDTGAVTQLKDLNHDGFFDYYNDILTGMPGARGPHMQHLNYGIVFGPDGSLYVTNGVASMGLDEHPWGGALLKLSPDFKKTEVFATGFRNVFGITVNKDGEVFLLDNDVEENPGDELDHVVKGEHYGHPFYYPNHPGKEPVGFRDQIHLGLDNNPSNYVGMAYTNSPMLPDEFRDCLYVADLSANQVTRVKVKRAGETYEVVEVEPFASIPSPVDIAIAEDGTMYVASRYDQKIIRIRLRDSLGTQGDTP
jgi:sugar lactone lactonase YvrE